MLHGQCVHGQVVTASLAGITTFTVTEVIAPLAEPTRYTGSAPTGKTAQATGPSNTFRSVHGGIDPTTLVVTTPTVANKTTPPDPTPVPTPTPGGPTSSVSGMSTAGIAAIFGVVSSILLSCIAVWQGFCYPRREHKKKMKKHDVELQTVVAERKTAEARLKFVEEELAHQKEAAGVALGEPSNSNGMAE
ncbi:hypothetical protein FRB94_007325 [Tulasnella sp. JGI-2019a]|nr:hypothetical protein FRB94_007325 [Tulasnella sp. JGI-2019a]